jgi:hypothetical protein
MRRSAVALLPAIGLLLAVACSDRDSANSRGPLTAPATSAFTIVPATSCDIEVMESAAHAYFSSHSDVVFQTIELMESARNHHNSAAANAYGFVMLREVADKRLTSGVVASATAAGASFVIDVLRCTTLTFPPLTSPDVKQSFLDNLVLILDAGVFEVRGGSGDATTSAAAYLSAGGVRTLAAPHWGVERHPNWPTDGHFLVFGYPTLNSNALIDPATNLNTNGPNTYNSFEIGTIPDSHPKTGLLVGVCYSSVTGTTAANRLIHNNADLFDNSPPTYLCSTPVASLASVKWYARAIQRAASLFAPKTAHAMQGGELDIGGLPSSWSPFATAKIVGSNVGTGFTTQPVNTAVGTAIPVVVRAMTNGVPVPGVAITLNIINNNGVPAGAVIVGGPPTVNTDSQGYATFSIVIGKAGGYNLVASGAMSGVVGTNTVTSVRINVKNH